MATVYTPPGVTVQEFSNPSVQPIITAPTSICLVGLTTGAITRTDLIQLNGTTAVTLPSVPAGSTMSATSVNYVKAQDPVAAIAASSGYSTANGYVATTDYTLTPATFQIAATAGGSIPSGTWVYVNYTYIPSDYFTAIRLDNMNDIEDRFGSQYDPTGTIVNSPLSYAAAVALQNGATSVVCQPLFFTTTTAGINDVQTLTVNGAPTGGTFTLTFAGQTTAAIAYNATAATVQTAFLALSSVGAGNAAVTGSAGGPWTVTFQGALSNAPEPTIGHTDSFTGGTTPALSVVHTTVGQPPTTTGRVQPTATQAADPNQWANTFAALRDFDDVNVIVPVVGQSQANVGDSTMLSIESNLQDHIYFQKYTNQQYVLGIVGEDASASTTVAQKATLQTHATTLAGRYANDVSPNLVFVSPAKFTRTLPTSVNTIFIGGQYMAAAIAGMLASRSTSATLTRKTVAGFVSVADYRSRADKNNDAGSGLLVVEQKGGIIQVRHAITIDTSATARRELSVVRSKFRVIQSVRNTLELNVIGQVVADDGAPVLIQGAVASVLNLLHNTGDIVAYSSIQARPLSLDPTKYEVRFAYRPAFPINYINVGFSLDLTTGEIQLPATTQSDIGLTG